MRHAFGMTIAAALCVGAALLAQEPPPMAETGAPVDPASFAYSRALTPAEAGLVSVPLDAHVLAHSRGRHGRLSDLRVVDDDGRQVPYVLEEQGEPMALDLPLALRPDPPEGLRAVRGLQSVYAMTLPYGPLPGARLALDTSARVFDRRVQVAFERPPDRRNRQAWLDILADVRWSQADPDTPAPALVLTLREVEGTELLLVVHEGDNSPLTITASRLLLPSYRLYFRHPAGASLRVYYGQPALGTPRYDLALRAGELLDGEATELALGEVSGVTTGNGNAPGVMPRGIFWTVLAGAVLALLALIARLVRTG